MTAETIRTDEVVTLTYSLFNQSGEVFEQNSVLISYPHGRDSGLFETPEELSAGHLDGQVPRH